MKKILILVLTVLTVFLFSCAKLESDIPDFISTPQVLQDESTVLSSERIVDTLNVQFPEMNRKEYSMPKEDKGYSVSETYKKPLAVVEFEYADDKSSYAMLGFCEHTLKDANTVYYNCIDLYPQTPVEVYYAYQSYQLYDEPIGDDEFYREYFHKDILIYPDRTRYLRYEDGVLYEMSSESEKIKGIVMPENTQIEQYIDGRYIVFTAFDAPFFATYICDTYTGETTLLADLVTDPILSPDLEFLLYSSISGGKYSFASPENGLYRMACGFYILNLQNRKVHFYSYPSELRPNARLEVKNWITSKKVPSSSIYHFRNVRHESELEEFFSGYKTVENYYYWYDYSDVDVEPDDLYDAELETRMVEQKDFDFGQYAALISYTKEGKKHFSVVSNYSYDIEEGEKLYHKLNANLTDQGRTLYLSDDMHSAVFVENNVYKVMSGKDVKAEGTYNGEDPEYLVYLANTNKDHYIPLYGGEIINHKNTEYVIDKTVDLKVYEDVGEAYVDLSILETIGGGKVYKLTTPKSYDRRTANGEVESFEASPIFFDGIWQLLEVKNGRGEQAVYGISLNSKNVVLMAKNVSDPCVSQSGSMLSYKVPDDPDGLYIRKTTNGDTVYYSSEEYDNIELVGWIDEFPLFNHTVEQTIHVLKESPEVNETEVLDICIDIPAYSPQNIVKPSEFNFGKYIPFVSYSIAQYTNNGASSIQSFALLGKNVETVNQGRALYEKFDALFHVKYPRIDLPFSGIDREDNPWYYKLASDMLFNSRVMYISEDGRTVGNLSLLYSEKNYGKDITDLLMADWNAKYDIITDGQRVSAKYTVNVDYQVLYEGIGYEYTPEENVYQREIDGRNYHVDIGDKDYRVYSSSDDTHVIYSIYSLDDLKLKYKIKIPYSITVNGKKNEAYYTLQSVTDDGKILLDMYGNTQENEVRFCALLVDAVNGSYQVLENYTYNSRLSPDGKYLVYTSPIYDFDPYTTENGLFYMADGYYVKNLEDGKTAFYPCEPYFWQTVVGWVDEDSICEQIGGYDVSELQAVAESYQDYDVVALEDKGDAPLYDFTDIKPDEMTDLADFTLVECEKFDFGGYGITFYDKSEGVLLTNGVSDTEEGKRRYGELEIQEEKKIRYFTLLAYGSLSEYVAFYEDNIVFNSGYHPENVNYIFSKREKTLKYSVKCSSANLIQVNDDFLVFRKKYNDLYNLIIVDIKTGEIKTYNSKDAKAVFSPDRKYLISYSNNDKGVFVRNLEDQTMIFYKTQYNMYNAPEWIEQ